MKLITTPNGTTPNPYDALLQSMVHNIEMIAKATDQVANHIIDLDTRLKKLEAAHEPIMDGAPAQSINTTNTWDI